MASQPEKIATLEEKVKAFENKKLVEWYIFVPVVIAALGWLVYLTLTLNKISERVAHMEGKVGDPLSTTIRNLNSPISTEALVANLKMLAAQIDVDKAASKKPKQENISRIAKTLSSVAEKDPQLSETWQAVATLASYSTSGKSRQLPDCDVTQAKKSIYAEEIRNVPQLFGRFGFLFRNCTLHMNHLPPGNVIRGKAVPPGQVSPQPYIAGAIAVIVDCDIVLTDEGVADSEIAFFYSYNSRFDYQIVSTPTSLAQKILLASIQSSKPGDFSLNVTQMNS